MEVWRDIEGYEGLYQVSNLGNIKSLAFGPKNHPNVQPQERLLKISKSSTGYMHVQLYKEGISSTKLVHKLVASTFIDNPYNKPEVNHIDSNRTNNNVENLEWVTRTENMRHAANNRIRKQTNQNNKESRIKKRGKYQVLQYTPDGKFVNIWNSVSDVVEFYKCDKYGIYRSIAGKNKTSICYRWLKHKPGENIQLKIPALNYQWRAETEKSYYHRTGRKGKMVEQYTLNGEFVKKWENCIQAAEELSVDKQNIYKCANGKARKAYGYIWKWDHDSVNVS